MPTCARAAETELSLLKNGQINSSSVLMIPMVLVPSFQTTVYSKTAPNWRPSGLFRLPRSRQRNRADLVAGCARLIAGQDVDPALLLALGGPAAEKFLDGEEHADTCWLRVWGVRGLLWAGDGSQLDAVRTALDDESCRVRELAAGEVLTQAGV